MPDLIYTHGIRVSAGPFTIRTSTYQGGTVIERRINDILSKEWYMSLGDLELLANSINEYLRKRSMENE